MYLSTQIKLIELIHNQTQWLLALMGNEEKIKRRKITINNGEGKKTLLCWEKKLTCCTMALNVRSYTDSITLNAEGG